MTKKEKILIAVIVVCFVVLIGEILLFNCVGKYNGGSNETGNQEILDNPSNSENQDNEENNTNVTPQKMTEQEALALGQALYNEAEKIYERNSLKPYCECENNNIYLGEENLSPSYCESKFSNLNELKDSLKNKLSLELVENLIGNEVYNRSDINDFGNFYNYVIDNDKLFCLTASGKGWLTFYAKYNLVVDSIDINKIEFTATTKYIKEEIVDQNLQICNARYPENCPDEYLDNKTDRFVIEKQNNNWIVTEFTLHD